MSLVIFNFLDGLNDAKLCKILQFGQCGRSLYRQMQNIFQFQDRTDSISILAIRGNSRNKPCLWEIYIICARSSSINEKVWGYSSRWWQIMLDHVKSSMCINKYADRKLTNNSMAPATCGSNVSDAYCGELPMTCGTPSFRPSNA